MSFTVATIVEGHGDVEAVPVLLRRIQPLLHVARPVRIPRSKLIGDPAEVVRAAKIAASNIREAGAVLLVIDADEDCPVTLAAECIRAVTGAGLAHPFLVAIPKREFEAWIVGGDDDYGIDDADVAGDCKGRIKAKLGRYKETVDQPRLIARVDLSRLERCSRSYRHLKRLIDGLPASLS